MAGSTKPVHAGWAMPGDVLTYTLQLQYQHRAGEPNQRWVVLTDTLPLSHQVRFLGWAGAMSGTVDGQQLKWQGQVRAGEPLSLQYRLGVEMTVTPGTIIANGAELRWSNGEMQLRPVTMVVTMPHYAHMFGPNGGEWAHQYGVTLTVPPQAVTETTSFQFREMSQTEITSGPPGIRPERVSSMSAPAAAPAIAASDDALIGDGIEVLRLIHFADLDLQRPRESAQTVVRAVE